MKLTPLDIHHKEFRHSLRGYDVDEVDKFLDDVADEFERLFKENIDLSERLEAANITVRQFQDQEQTIRNTMVAAQRSAEDIIAKSREESATVLRDAEVRAKEIIHNALTQKQKVAAELLRIKQAEEDFRGRFKAMLEGHMKGVAEIELPEDVTLLVGETDSGFVADVDVAAPVPAPATVQTPVEPEMTRQAPAVAETLPVTDVEPPASGFVQSVTLGEVDAPDLSEIDTVLDDPREFDFSSFDDLGEPEDDIDIEEID
jgi:cell division initiation protein